MAEKKKQRRRDRLLKQHPYCWRCGVKLIAWKSKKGVPDPDNMATIGHRHGRLDPNRREDCSGQNQSRLECKKCNQELGRRDELQVGIDELRRRSGRYPLPTPPAE